MRGRGSERERASDDSDVETASRDIQGHNLDACCVCV